MEAVRYHLIIFSVDREVGQSKGQRKIHCSFSDLCITQFWLIKFMTGKINSFHFNSQNLTLDEDLQFCKTAYGSKKFQNYYNKFYFIPHNIAA